MGQWDWHDTLIHAWLNLKAPATLAQQPRRERMIYLSKSATPPPPPKKKKGALDSASRTEKISENWNSQCQDVPGLAPDGKGMGQERLTQKN